MNVFIVSIDWGTMDGFPTHSRQMHAYTTKEAADEVASQAKNRTPFPAVSADVVMLELKA